jgi:hypothetical protein
MRVAEGTVHRGVAGGSGLFIRGCCGCPKEESSRGSGTVFGSGHGGPARAGGHPAVAGPAAQAPGRAPLLAIRRKRFLTPCWAAADGTTVDPQTGYPRKAWVCKDSVGIEIPPVYGTHYNCFVPCIRRRGFELAPSAILCCHCCYVPPGTKRAVLMTRCRCGTQRKDQPDPGLGGEKG